MTMKVIALFLLILSSSCLQVARCQSDLDTEVTEAAEEGGDLGIVGEDVRDFSGEGFTVLVPHQGWKQFVFSQKTPQTVMAGEESELLVGIKNVGESSVDVIAVRASVHLPYDHRMLVQNLSTQAFNNATVPPSAQATFPYIFAVSKFLQGGTFDLVGYIVYEIEQHQYQSTFYNGTIDVTEAGGFVSVESVFLFSLGVALLVLLALWVHSQIQRLSKKTKRVPKVEVGTGTTDTSMDEWLQGTAYTQSLSSKSKKKK